MLVMPEENVYGLDSLLPRMGVCIGYQQRSSQECHCLLLFESDGPPPVRLGFASGE
jgi:hypothetical protein